MVKLDVCEQEVSRRCTFQTTRRVADCSLGLLIPAVVANEDQEISRLASPNDRSSVLVMSGMLVVIRRAILKIEVLGGCGSHGSRTALSSGSIWGRHG